MISFEKFQVLEQKKVIFFIHLNFERYYCSVNLKRQSERSGLRPDTRSLVFFKDKDSYPTTAVCELFY